jgi:hypothetical protein
MEIGVSVVYTQTCAVPAYVLSQELLELLMAAKSLNLTVAEYICLCHAEWGVNHCLKNGNPDWTQQMVAVANGEDV